jgi:MFS family permease
VIIAASAKKKSGTQWQVALYAAVVTFLAYATVYGFRKPYTVATYDHQLIFGLGYKEILVIIQALGYMSSKFYGIRFISELKRTGRWKIILLLIGISWLAWFLFAVIPPPYNVLCLFLNGFPLGLLWGIIFSYIEGRRATDFIGTAMAVSFIFSSGLVKTVGKWLMVSFHISETWMPFFAGAFFLPFLLLFVYLLEKLPPPTREDINLRTERNPMTGKQRKQFLQKFFPGISILIIIYVFLTIFRDVRDNFIADIWNDMGYKTGPELFTLTEIPVTLIVFLLLASMMAIRSNTNALMITHVIILAGFLVAGISTLMFTAGLVNPVYWVMLVGLGLYMGYIPYNCVLFERMIAAFRISGNIGFLMYLSDSFGYLGSVTVIIGKVLLVSMNYKVKWVELFSNGVIILSLLGAIGTMASAYYFRKKKKIIQVTI